MTNVIERPIPGGRGFDLRGERGWRVEVAVHDAGDRELHMFPRGGNEPNASVRMDDDDARRLGAVLSGTRLRPAMPEHLRERLRDVVVDWIRVDAASGVVGRTLEELDLHRRTAMTVIAVVRDGRAIAPAPSDVPLEANDRVVVVGRLRQLSVATDLLTG